MKTKIYKKINHGLTLVEIVAVLFIIGLMIGIAAPYFRGGSKAQERHGAANTIISIIRQARELAVAKFAVYSVDFDTNNRTVRIIDTTGTINQVGKTYYLPKYLDFDRDDLATRPLPVDFDFEPQGHILTSPVNSIFIEHTSRNGLYDRIDVIPETGQVNLTKDTTN